MTRTVLTVVLLGFLSAQASAETMVASSIEWVTPAPLVFAVHLDRP